MPPRRDPQPALGRALATLRAKADLSQEDVSARTGLHVTWVSRIETGLVNPSWATVHKLAAALGVTVSELAALEAELEAKRRGRGRRGGSR